MYINAVNTNKAEYIPIWKVTNMENNKTFNK